MYFSETSLLTYANFCGEHCFPSHAPQETHAAPALGSVQRGAPEFNTFPSYLSLPSGFAKVNCVQVYYMGCLLL